MERDHPSVWTINILSIREINKMYPGLREFTLRPGSALLLNSMGISVQLHKTFTET